MDRANAKKFLACIGAEQIGDRGDWVTCSCPLAPWTHTSGTDKKPSFAIRVMPGLASYYNCYSCGGGPELHRLILRMRELGAIPSPKVNTAAALQILASEASGDMSLSIRDYEEPVQEEVIFPEQWLEFFPKAHDVPEAMDYLSTRQLTGFVIEELDLRWDAKRKAIVFPHRNFGGLLIGARSRLIDPPTLDNGSVMKYYVYKSGQGKHNSVHWYGEDWVDFSKPVIMVESVFDVASVLRVYPNVVAPLSAGFSKEKGKRMQDCTVIITLMDAGMGGDVCRNKIATQLGHAEQHHIHLTEGDPGDLTAPQVQELLDPFIGGGIVLQIGDWH